jgi:hypothetical protein
MAVDYTNLQKMAQQYQPSQPPPSYQPGPQKPKSGTGCVLILVLLAFFAGMGALVYFWVYPTYFSGVFNKDEKTVVDKKTGKEKKVSKKSEMDGILSNVLAAPGEEGKNNIWVITYKYISSNYTINTYIYNPEEKKIIKEFETESKGFPASIKLFYMNNKVWKANSSSSGLDAEVYAYNPSSGEEIYNTRSFCNKFPELEGGISNLNVFDNPPYIGFDTRDGRKPVYDLENDKMYQSSTEFRNSYKNEKGEMSIFAIGVEKSGEEARKRLYLVTGPKSSLKNDYLSESYFTNPSTLKFFTKSEAKVLTDKVYLEGILLYKDDECCFVFYQNQTGNEAERYLACVDTEGNTLWTVSTENELFEKLRATSKDAFSTMFFIKSNVHVSRAGDLVVFSYDRFGYQGYDYKTGKKLFEEELSK